MEVKANEVDVPSSQPLFGSKPLRRYLSIDLLDAFNHPEKSEGFAEPSVIHNDIEANAAILLNCVRQLLIL